MTILSMRSKFSTTAMGMVLMTLLILCKMSSVDAFSRLFPHTFFMSSYEGTLQSMKLFDEKGNVLDGGVGGDNGKIETGESIPNTPSNHNNNNNNNDDNNHGGKSSATTTTSSSSSSTTTTTSGYAMGTELELLRGELETFRQTLQWAQATDDQERMIEIAKAIERAEARDPDLVYARTTEKILNLQKQQQTSGAAATTRGMIHKEIDTLTREAQAARACLPRFQLEGLWVGNFGAAGLELVNVTYSGDNLIATKVTGDINVPRGQVSFNADLSPRVGQNATTKAMVSLPLHSVTATKGKLSSATVERFPGKGQVAKPGFVDKKFVTGQLTLMKDSFSFLWIGVPPQSQPSLGLTTQQYHQVLFRRPTPQQTITLLRDVISKEDELQNMREHLSRCLEIDATESLARHFASNGGGLEPFRRISTHEELEALQRKYEQGNNKVRNPLLLKASEPRSVVDRFLSSIRSSFISLQQNNTDSSKA